jgi:peptidyl-prolyl cis-trans isomerase SurA
MNKYAIFFFILFILNYYNFSYAEYENKIVLKVENKIITNFEIKNKILTSLVLSEQDINQNNINLLKDQSLDSLIHLKLKEIELSKFNIEINPLQINQYLNSVSANNIPELKKKFSNNNLDFQLYLREVETQYKWQKLIYEIYSNKIEIDPKSVDAELKNYTNEKSNIKEFNLSEIEIFFKDNKKDKISNIKKLINENGFEETAINYSVSSSAPNKGNIGWVNSKILTDKMFSTLNKMKKGEISPPIINPNSILILKINDIRLIKPKQLNTDDLKKKIIEKKKNELFTLYSRSHLSKLQNSSLIEYK